MAKDCRASRPLREDAGCGVLRGGLRASADSLVTQLGNAPLQGDLARGQFVCKGCRSRILNSFEILFEVSRTDDRQIVKGSLLPDGQRLGRGFDSLKRGISPRFTGWACRWRPDALHAVVEFLVR